MLAPHHPVMRSDYPIPLTFADLFQSRVDRILHGINATFQLLGNLAMRCAVSIQLEDFPFFFLRQSPYL
jgi:hypothetical protein